MSKTLQDAATPQLPEELVPVAAWTADAETRKARSAAAAATLRANQEDPTEAARLEALSRERSESLAAVAAFVANRLQRSKGPHGVGELTALALQNAAVQATPFPSQPGTAQRWTVRRCCKALEKAGVAKQTTEERKGRKVRCWTYVAKALRS